MNPVLEMRPHVGTPALPLDVAGIGIGPFNLSVAALLDSVPGLNARFFEKKKQFIWHQGLMFPGSILQTSFLKDLVTPVLPTSPHSFTAFLVEKKRFYDFLSGRFTGVTRMEFNEYLQWVSGRLDTLAFGEEATAVHLDGSRLRLEFASGRTELAHNLIAGAGMAPFVPPCTAAHLGADCFHAGSYLTQPRSFTGKRVAVIGGGQTGAEIVLDLLTRAEGAPAHVSWISNLPRFSPLEEGGFVDQVFTPGYVAAYQTLPFEAQRSEISGQKLASDGLTPATVDTLFAEIYRRRHLLGENCISLLPGRNLEAMDRQNGGFLLHTHAITSGESELFGADAVILATGARPALPACLEPLRHRLDLDANGLPVLDVSYRLQWDGPSSIGLFGLNLGLSSHGIVDPQMSLMAWRSAVIINALTGEDLFDVSAGPELVDWPKRLPDEAPLTRAVG